MAWIRTSTSLISFGFTIYKFFEYVVEAAKLPLDRRGLGPRGFALSMIGLGVVTLVVATFQQRKDMNILEKEYGIQRASFAIKLAAGVSVAGFALLAIVLLHL
jgi:putative membrane protein